jgi:hypothetical protein
MQIRTPLGISAFRIHTQIPKEALSGIRIEIRNRLGFSVFRIHTQIPKEAVRQELPARETGTAAAGRPPTAEGEARVAKAARASLDTVEAIA